MVRWNRAGAAGGETEDANSEGMGGGSVIYVNAIPVVG